MKPPETIIIGGGVSGLACGRTLHDKGHDFILLTEEIGGRMLTLKSHKVNYGASYITEDYLDNLMALVCKIYVADHSRCCYLLPKGWGKKIVQCRVTQLHRTADGLFQVTAGDKTFRAENVVLALPYHNAKRVYDLRFCHGRRSGNGGCRFD